MGSNGETGMRTMRNQSWHDWGWGIWGNNLAECKSTSAIEHLLQSTNKIFHIMSTESDWKGELLACFFEWNQSIFTRTEERRYLWGQDRFVLVRVWWGIVGSSTGRCCEEGGTCFVPSSHRGRPPSNGVATGAHGGVRDGVGWRRWRCPWATMS
jgi:hypothetical protein